MFDAKGRLLVGMGPQYRNPKLDTPGDSVIIVSDTDGDGVADKTKVFATGFNCIQSLAWHVRPLRDAVSDVTNIGTGEVAYGRGKCQTRTSGRRCGSRIGARSGGYLLILHLGNACEHPPQGSLS